MVSDTSGLDAILKKYTQQLRGDDGLRGAAFIAKNANGETIYSHAEGRLSSDSDSPPFTQDSVGWVASLSKLATTVAALQVVDKGLIGLDDDAGKHVPYLTDVKVFKGLDTKGDPIIQARQKPITMRHLLTHTSGFCYTSLSTELRRWCMATDRQPTDMHRLSDMKVPLIFEPGASWSYSKGLDWAGRVVEAVSGVSLEDYMRRNIFEPLHMDSTTFFIQARPDLKHNRSDIEYKVQPDQPKELPAAMNIDDPEIAFGGSGLFTTGNDYIKLLGALLTKGSRTPILSDEALKSIYIPQLDDRHVHTMTTFCTMFDHISPIPDISLGKYEPPIPLNFGLGGCINMEDVPGHRKKGSITWRSATNGYWWIDPTTGITAVVFLQVLPYGAKACSNLAIELETETYKIWG